MPLSAPKRSVMEEVFGEKRFASLPAALRKFHGAQGPLVWSGTADIETGAHPIAKALSAIFRFPPGGREVPLTVTIERRDRPDGVMEVWTRHYGGARMISRLTYTKHTGLSEAFGPLSCGIVAVIRNGGIELAVVSASLFRLPLPRFLLPRTEAREFTDDENRFRFDVKLSLPLIGLLTHYRGWLTPGYEETSGFFIPTRRTAVSCPDHGQTYQSAIVNLL